MSIFWRTIGHIVFRFRDWLWQRLGEYGAYRHSNRPPIKQWWVHWCDTGFQPCEVCGYSGDWGTPPWFSCERAGTSFNGEYTAHWFEGIQTCPRCRCTWPYGDSD